MAEIHTLGGHVQLSVVLVDNAPTIEILEDDGTTIHTVALVSPKQALTLANELKNLVYTGTSVGLRAMAESN